MKLFNYMDNGQANAMCLELDFYMEIWFSYETPVAFRTPETGLIVSQNIWTTTTGKHLNAIDNGNKMKRIPNAEFTDKLRAMLSKFHFESRD